MHVASHGRIVLSAADLSAFPACRGRTSLDLAVALGLLERPRWQRMPSGHSAYAANHAGWGMFITTSRLAETAQEFVLRGSSTRVQPSDGQKLFDPRMRHHVGVRVQRTIEVLDLEHNRFEDEE